MEKSWTSCIVVTALAASAIGFFMWRRMRKNFTRVGKVAKLYFYPVKSLKGIEITKGRCTKYGFEVNGLLERSFMVINEKGVVLTQLQAPTLVLLTTDIRNNDLIINAPDKEPLKIEIKSAPSPGDKMINCKIEDNDDVGGFDCGDQAALWFESYLAMKGTRLVRFFETATLRKDAKLEHFYIKLKKIAFHEEAALHVISQASVDDLNSKLDKKKITACTFRPNIVAEGCGPFEEDSWKYFKFPGGAVASISMLASRCLMTTNDPETGTLSKKEPLVTLRKYRIPKDPELLKILGPHPCFGTRCAVLSPGDVSVGDDIFAVAEKQPEMQIRST